MADVSNETPSCLIVEHMAKSKYFCWLLSILHGFELNFS
jgi:hypothetical protein